MKNARANRMQPKAEATSEDRKEWMVNSIIMKQTPMGCCFSTPTTQTPYQSHPQPPQPPSEEESVKEVLSETPVSKPQQVPILTPETKTHLPLLQNPPTVFHENDDDPIQQLSEPVSQLSETCSMSESFSTATATTVTVPEKREEDEATSKPHKWDRSPSRKRPLASDAAGRDRRLKSPARRPEPSPETKIKASPRPLRGREPGPPVNRRRTAGPAALRRDSGEISGRRSRSPAFPRAGKAASGGCRKEASSAAAAKEKKKKTESEEVAEENDVDLHEKVVEKNDIVSHEEVVEKHDVVAHEECIENPQVSMECFIFL
ncbi:hypothetical protein Fmac_021688 [Flemingia macrophylla]|uniref:Uncharacterized protein n=1 Tax=Flemingia macrophylla TaxID=520843 RepID=A0ABD1LXP7_9FABA